MAIDPLKAIQAQIEANKKLLEQLKELNALREKDTEELKRQNKTVKEQESYAEKIKKLQDEVLLGQKHYLGFFEKRKVAEQASADDAKRRKKDLENEIKKRNELLELAKKATGDVKKELEDGLKKNKISEDSTKELEKQLKELDKQSLIKQRHILLAQQNQDAIKGIGEKLGLASDVNKTWLGRLENTLQSFGSISASVRGIGRGLVETITPTQIFAAAVTKVATATWDMALRMDTSIAAFNQATGAGGQFNQVIDKARFGSMALGVGMDQAVKATQDLHGSFTGFTQLNAVTQTEIVKTTAVFEKLGIAGGTLGKNLEFSTKALGMTVDESMHAQKQIAATALELGIAPGKMAGDFAAASPILARYGKESVQMFRELATQSRATGIEISSLINISSKFDTFKGAAESAGKLNAILGGNLLNSSELLAASESERIDLLRQSIDQSGKNWSSMDKFQKMAVASAAGITDMAEANKLFGTSAEAYDKMRKAKDMTALSDKELAARAAAASSAQDGLKLLTESLTVAALPLVNAMNSIMTAFLTFTDSLGNQTGPILVIVTGFIYLLAKGIMWAWNKIMGLSNAVKEFTVSLVKESVAEGQNALAKQANIAATTEQMMATKAKSKAVDSNSEFLMKERGSEVQNMVAKQSNTVATEASAFATHRKIAATEKDVVLTKSSTLATQSETGAKTGASIATRIRNGVETIANSIRQKGIIGTIREGVVTAAVTIQTWLMTAAKGAYAVIAGIATTVTTGLTAALALLTLPVALVIAGILLLVAAVAVFIYYFEDISAWVSELTGGFMDLWDVLLLGIGFIAMFVPGVGPIIALIAFAIEIWKNWDTVVGVFGETVDWLGSIFDSVFTSVKAPLNELYNSFQTVVKGIETLFTSMWNVVKSVFTSIWDIYKTPLNMGIRMINTITSKASVLPGVNIPPIPELAEGVTNFSGGMALVGEEGPELVNMAKGSNVITNENTNKLSSAGSELQKTRIEQNNNQINSMEKIINSSKETIREGSNQKDSGERTLILQLDGREFGRAVVNIFEKKMKLNMVGG